MPLLEWPRGVQDGPGGGRGEDAGVPPRGSLVARHILETHPLISKGRTAPGIFAPIATRYFHQYGYGKETLAKVAVKNHYNGS